MNSIDDIIYVIESSSSEFDYELTKPDSLKAAKFLINNLDDNHKMPGSVYYQFTGILDWYREHQFITEKQHHWLMSNLWLYISQRSIWAEIH